jgi:hypothetical protein
MERCGAGDVDMTLEISNGKPTRLFPVWKELVKIADTWDYGSFHSHEEIAAIMDLEPKTSKYYQNIQKAREELIEHRKLLETYINQGYLVVEVDRYNEVTFEDLKRSKRYLELSILKSNYAPVEMMDQRTKERHDVFLTKQIGLLNMTAPAYTEITKVIAPIPALFRIKEMRPAIKEVDEI